MNKVYDKEFLSHLIHDWEHETVEFKQAGSDYSTDKIGQYFSALSNEANLRNRESAWLVFGIDNKTRAIVGTNYRPEQERLNSLKMQISENTEPSITLRNIHEIHNEKGRVILFEIPSAPLGLPISWKGHYYARSGESLTHLGIDKQDDIRKQSLENDWSIGIVEGASFTDLDTVAIETAKSSYIKKYSNRISEKDIREWSVETFLNRARLTVDSKITRTALLLLGKHESASYLSPHPAQLTWKLEGEERAYEHFGPPFLLNTTKLYQKIRNFQIKILPDDALLPVEISKYDQSIVMEALHNCIAHQDYRRNGRIVVTEYPDKLSFENEGSFFEGKPEDYFNGEKTPRRYRNSFLSQAMTELNMIDTMGYGIYKMHMGQAKRFFPLPDYDLSNPNSVLISIHGGIVDLAYTRLLIQKSDLTIMEITALDRVQKKIPLSDEQFKMLKKAKLIEGRKPNIHVSEKVVKIIGSKTDYIKTRSQSDDFYAKLIFDYLVKFKTASREDIDKLLMDKISDVLDIDQKNHKIANLLTKLRRNGKIVNTGSKKKPVWVRPV